MTDYLFLIALFLCVRCFSIFFLMINRFRKGFSTTNQRNSFDLWSGKSHLKFIFYLICSLLLSSYISRIIFLYLSYYLLTSLLLSSYISISLIIFLHLSYYLRTSLLLSSYISFFIFLHLFFYLLTSLFFYYSPQYFFFFSKPMFFFSLQLSQGKRCVMLGLSYMYFLFSCVNSPISSPQVLLFFCSICSILCYFLLSLSFSEVVVRVCCESSYPFVQKPTPITWKFLLCGGLGQPPSTQF